MNNKTRLENVISKLWLVLVLMIVGQLFFLAVFYIVSNMLVKMANSINPDSIHRIKSLFLIGYALIMICIDIYFYIKKILGTKSLIGLKPLECVVEDYVIRKYKNRDKTDYEIKLLVRCLEDGKYYFTFDRYSYCYFSHIFSLNAHKIKEVVIIREDKSVVNVGDTAYLYIKNTVNPKIKIKDNSAIVDNLKYSLLNKNENLNINVFNEVVFFKGLIDVEK